VCICWRRSLQLLRRPTAALGAQPQVAHAASSAVVPNDGRRSCVTLMPRPVRRRSPAAASVSTTAAARLVALETLHARQSEALRGADRGLERVQTRVGLLSRDLRTTVRQVTHYRTAALRDEPAVP